MRILIVEDERLIRERLLRMCGELTGGRRGAVRTPRLRDLDQAGDRLQRSLYDGLLLDLNLGGRRRLRLAATWQWPDAYHLRAVVSGSP
ncbi:hypothetical protein [Xanthomonas campestris]|uniref:hypothetical protein n=1 Tax=Xanthomonas campestris TaxID=339 RepID=UPI001F38C55A|nr:hypothetical protein [Xanthomonas campestris]